MEKFDGGTAGADVVVLVFNHRTSRCARADIVGLMGCGACLGVGIAGLFGRLKLRNRVVRHHHRPVGVVHTLSEAQLLYLSNGRNYGGHSVTVSIPSDCIRFVTARCSLRRKAVASVNSGCG